MNDTPCVIYEGRGRDRTVRLAPGEDISMRAAEERATPWRRAFDALTDALGPDDKVLRDLAEEALYRAAAEIGRLRGIARLAGYVRACQKEYFRTRSRDYLVASKTAEKALDDALAGRGDNTQAQLRFQP